MEFVGIRRFEVGFVERWFVGFISIYFAYFVSQCFVVMCVGLLLVIALRILVVAFFLVSMFSAMWLCSCQFAHIGLTMRLNLVE